MHERFIKIYISYQLLNRRACFLRGKSLIWIQNLFLTFVQSPAINTELHYLEVRRLPSWQTEWLPWLIWNPSGFISYTPKIKETGDNCQSAVKKNWDLVEARVTKKTTKKNSMDLTDTSLFFFSSYSKRRKGEKRNWKKNDQRLPKKKKESEQPLLQSKFQPTCSRTPFARSFSMGEGVRLHAGLK